MEDQRNGIACMKDSSIWKRDEWKVFGRFINEVHKTVENINLSLLSLPFTLEIVSRQIPLGDIKTYSSQEV